MKLPAACSGCPLASQNGQFVPRRVKESAPVLVVRDTPDQEESRDARYAKLAGMLPEAFNLTSAIRCTGVLPKRQSKQATDAGKKGPAEVVLEFCQQAHGRIPSGTRLIVTRGEDALWSVAGLNSSTSWRGWVVPRRGFGNGWRQEIWTPSSDCAPSVLVHAPTADPLAQRLDWRKVRRVLDGSWPVPFPGYRTDSPAVWPKLAAFDTEFQPETKQLTRYSLFSGEEKPWVVEAQDVKYVPMAPPGPVTVFLHNEGADIRFLRRILGPGTKRLRIEDTMLMDAALWSDRPHSLEYLGSLYGRLNRSKHLGYESVDYSAADAILTWDVAKGIMKEMQEDPVSYRDYRESLYPLTPIIMEAEQAGLRLDQSRVQEALQYYRELQMEVTGQAQAYTGFPINLGSPDQVQAWVYGVEKVGQSVKTRGR